MSFHSLEENHLACSYHTAPSSVSSVLRTGQRRFKVISIGKPRYALKCSCESVVESFEFKSSSVVGVRVPLVQQKSLLL